MDERPMSPREAHEVLRRELLGESCGEDAFAQAMESLSIDMHMHPED